jgi:hypothetical protein
MKQKPVQFVLSPKERQLVLKHGYPFEEFETALKACEESNEPMSFVLEPFWFEHLLGEIARSANHTSDQELNDRLSELYEYLLSEARQHGLAVY